MVLKLIVNAHYNAILFMKFALAYTYRLVIKNTYCGLADTY